jgi:hypothetical protein
MISRAKSPLLQAIVECISTGHHAPWVKGADVELKSSELFLFAYVCGAHPVKRFVPRGHPVLHFCFRYGYYCNGQCNRLAAFHHHPLASGFVTLQLLLVAGETQFVIQVIAWFLRKQSLPKVCWVELECASSDNSAGWS